MTALPPTDPEWQRIWFSARQHGWNSLAIVPSHSGIDVLAIAKALAATGRAHGERPVGVINATGVQLENVQQVIATLGALPDRGESALVPVDPIDENPSAVAIVQAASAALLVVRLGESRLGPANLTLEMIGRNRFLGSVILDDASRPLFSSSRG